MSSIGIDFSWKEHFRDPAQFWDNQKSKSGRSSSHSRHQQSREPLWMHNGHHPILIKEDLTRSRVPYRECEVLEEFQDRTALLNLIKSCGKQRDLHKGDRIHADILERGLLKNDVALGNALLSMYAKCGALAKAQEMFQQLPAQNVVKWNALISGYTQHGLINEALSCFEQMRDQGPSPDTVTFISVLKACGSIGATQKGEVIHAEVNRQGLLRKEIVLGTALVDMYAKCGVLAKAQGVFDKLPARDVVTWNALIAGYTQHGLGNEALSCFQQMRDEGLSPDAVTFACILKACGSIGATEKGEAIHAQVRKQGLLDKDIVLGNALVDMYAKCGALAKAQAVFETLPAWDVVTWNVLISGYAQHGLSNEALRSFGEMQTNGISPNAVTFVCILKACGNIGAIEKGEEIHGEVDRQGLLEKDDVLVTALVDMYVKCGALTKAQGVFNKLSARNVVTWNVLIAGYVKYGLGDEALSCFARMRGEGFSPDIITFVFILKACGSIGANKIGEAIHAELGRKELLGKFNILDTALVDMYAKCGALTKAQGAFDKLPARDAAMWTALIAGYAEHGLGDEALSCFRQMQSNGVSPDAVTFVCILKACGSIGAEEKGEEIHAEVCQLGLMGKDNALGAALVDMYAKCGALTNAQKVFDKLSARDIAMWTALLAGYAQIGKVKTVLNLLIKMIGEGIEPDAVTFVVLLTACSHAGLVEEGQMYFDIMSTVYHIIPTLEHCTCMVDIFSRSGHFDMALSMIQKVPPSDCLLPCLTLMGACQKRVNVELGRWAFERAIQLDRTVDVAYVCMRNVYAAAGMQEEEAVQVLKRRNGAWTGPGRCQWTDVYRHVDPFTSRDNSHP